MIDGHKINTLIDVRLIFVYIPCYIVIETIRLSCSSRFLLLTTRGWFQARNASLVETPPYGTPYFLFITVKINAALERY